MTCGHYCTADILDLIIKKINVNFGIILNYYGVKGAFKLS
jgi:hypothetical protein